MVETMVEKFMRRRVRMLKIFGYSAITIDGRKSVTKPSDVIYLAILLLFSTSIIVGSIIDREKFMKGKHEIADYGNYIAFIASLVLALISMINSFIFRHKIWELYLVLIDIDESYIEIGMEEDYLRLGKIFLATFSFLAFQLFPLTICLYAIEGAIIKALLYFYSGFHFTMSLSSMCGLLNAMRFRVKTLNKVLKTLKSDSKISSSQKILGLLGIYEKIIKGNNLSNLCFGFPVLLGFGLNFFYTIFTIFMTVRDILHGHVTNVTFASIVYCLYLHLFMQVALYFCTRFKSNSYETLKLVNQAMRDFDDKDNTSLLICLGTLIRNNMTNFTCGLFDFDWKMIYGMIAAGATNFIILLQFDIASNKLKLNNQVAAN